MSSIPNEDEIALAVLPALIQNSHGQTVDLSGLVQRAYEIADLVAAVREERQKRRNVARDEDLSLERTYYTKAFGLK